jgi:hypothetical protein
MLAREHRRETLALRKEMLRKQLRDSRSNGSESGRRSLAGSQA